MKNFLSFILFFSFITNTVYSQKNIFKGNVSFINESNDKEPLAGVTVYWLNTNSGTLSDIDGNYKIPLSSSSNKLVFKYLGFKEQIIEVTEKIFYNIIMLNDDNILDEVTVNKKRKTIQKSYFKTQNITNVSSDELLKAACCNISESFETNPSIDVNYSNAVTGVKQVKMLGLESPYLLITEENIPMIRGASQVYGLSFIPGTWVESMQITKGSGSVVNGFESVSG